MDRISERFLNEMIKDGKGDTYFLETPSGQKIHLVIEVLDQYGEVMIELNQGLVELVVNRIEEYEDKVDGFIMHLTDEDKKLKAAQRAYFSIEG